MDLNNATMEDETKHLPSGETTEGERDMISTLHESILGQILSFIPIVDAVRTSVLSRRWIEVWKSITILKFDDSLLGSKKKKMQKEQFVNLVEKVLIHFTNSSIQSFSLCLTSHQYDASRISEWIYFILERRVQKLHIQYADKVFLPSNSLFSCNSLVELTLQMRCTLSLPVSVCLRNLKKLSISGIKLLSDSSNYAKDITLNFPILKVFEARGCEWPTMQNISLQVPLLEKFSIAIWNRHSNESCKFAIKVYSPRLTDFSYEGDLEQDIFTNLPVFGRLTYLQLNEVTGEALLQLLHNSPILNTLVLLNGVADLRKDIFTCDILPHCFLSSFKVFQLKAFNANEYDLGLVKFMLENAAMLEKMMISLAFWLRYADIDLEKVKEQIRSLPSRSSFCMIEFSDISSS